MGSNILIVSAHPDDEALWMAGTLKKLIQSGNTVHFLLLAKPWNARPGEDPSIRLGAFEKVMKELGITHIYYEDFPDTSFDSVRLLDIVKSIEKVADTVKPEVVYTHFYNDLNIDHSIASRATITAFRPIERNKQLKKIYLFEIPSTTELGIGKERFQPNHYEDIWATIEKKKELLSYYKGELRKFPHPFSHEWIENYARFRWMESGLEFAEAFVLYRSIW